LNSRKKLRILILLLAWLCSGQVGAHYSLGNKFQAHGFLTQGYVRTTENSFFGDSESGSWDFRELGINASYRANPMVMVSAQILSRKAGKMYDSSPILDYGQLDLTAYDSEHGRFGTILGRFKNPFGFYNDTRDVAATRPSIFVPQVIYWERVRNMVLSNDGGMLYADIHRGLHSFYVHLLAGKTPIDENVEKSYLPDIFDPSLDQPGLTKGGRLLYEWNGGIFRLAFTGVSLQLDGTLHSLDASVRDGNVDIDYWIASMQYNRGPFSLTLEYMNEPLDYSGFGGMLDEFDTTIDGYYLQGAYRFASDWEAFIRYEAANYDKDDPKTSDEDPSNFVRMWTFGLLWEATDNLIFRTEFSRVDGTIFLSNLENDPLTTEREWNMFSLLASYLF
jgi:hypothetical protein